MTEPRSESQLVSQIVRAIGQKYPEDWVLKTHGDAYQRAGVPDLLIVHRGRLVAVEAKHLKPGESLEHLQARVTIRQSAELDNLAKAGALAFVAWEVEQVLNALSDLS